MKEVPLTQGKVALVDDDIYDYINQWKWYANSQGKMKRWYSKRYRRVDGVRINVSMHRDIFENFVCAIPYGFEIDHIDGDGLNNVLSNIRLASRSDNQKNRIKSIGCSSLYRGVSWNKVGRKWVSRICVDGIDYYLGGFVSEKDAARVYDEAAKKWFGEFARINFPTMF